MTGSIQIDLSTLSPELQLMLLQQQQGVQQQFVPAPQQFTVTAPTAPSEYIGNGGITFTTAQSLRNNLWDRMIGDGSLESGYDENSTVSLANGMIVSFHMLKTTKRWEDRRPSNGKKGWDYYLVWELTEQVGQDVVKHLEQYKLTPEAAAKQNNRGNRNNGGNRSFNNGGGNSSQNSNADIQALVQQQLAVALQQLGLNVPAPTVVPAPNHTIAAPNFSDVPAPTVAPVQQDIPTYYPGQALRCGVTGEVRYVSDAGIVRTVKNPVS